MCYMTVLQSLSYQSQFLSDLVQNGSNSLKFYLLGNLLPIKPWMKVFNSHFQPWHCFSSLEYMFDFGLCCFGTLREWVLTPLASFLPTRMQPGGCFLSAVSFNLCYFCPVYGENSHLIGRAQYCTATWAQQRSVRRHFCITNSPRLSSY